VTPAEFLRTVHPDGPWALAAIDPDLSAGHDDKIKCRTLPTTDEVGLARFIERHNDRRNVYYQINRVRPNLGGRRARKRHVVECVALHCEIDPPEGGDLAQWQQERRTELVAWRVADLPRPTMVVFSGSGFQLLWLLDEPTADVEAVESRNRALVRRFGGDAGTWTVDRLLRLPGTLNHPGERKRRKYGRTGPVLAEVAS
jgi:Mesyanzhinovviridae DNA primase